MFHRMPHGRITRESSPAPAFWRARPVHLLGLPGHINVHNRRIIYSCIKKSNKNITKNYDSKCFLYLEDSEGLLQVLIELKDRGNVSTP